MIFGSLKGRHQETTHRKGSWLLVGEEPYKVKIEPELEKKNSIKPMEKP